MYNKILQSIIIHFSIFN